MKLNIYYNFGALTWNPGFFCTYQSIVGFLDFIEKEKPIGFEVFLENGLYFDAAHGPNWWEYYFEPIKYGGFQEPMIIDYIGDMLKSAWGTDAISIISRERAGELINKYIKLKPFLQQKIDDFVKTKFGKHTIGCNMRGSDKSSEAPRVSYETIANEIKKHLQENSVIFAASDEQKFIEYMKSIFGSRVVYTDSIRSFTHEPIHHLNGKPCANPYKLGEDAVFDCYLLSKCNLLIKTFSNLSSSAANISPKMPVVSLNQATYRQGLR